MSNARKTSNLREESSNRQRKKQKIHAGKSVGISATSYARQRSLEVFVNDDAQSWTHRDEGGILGSLRTISKQLDETQTPPSNKRPRRKAANLTNADPLAKATGFTRRPNPLGSLRATATAAKRGSVPLQRPSTSRGNRQKIRGRQHGSTFDPSRSDLEEEAIRMQRENHEKAEAKDFKVPRKQKTGQAASVINDDSVAQFKVYNAAHSDLAHRRSPFATSRDTGGGSRHSPASASKMMEGNHAVRARDHLVDQSRDNPVDLCSDEDDHDDDNSDCQHVVVHATAEPPTNVHAEVDDMNEHDDVVDVDEHTDGHTFEHHHFAGAAQHTVVHRHVGDDDDDDDHNVGGICCSLDTPQSESSSAFQLQRKYLASSPGSKVEDLDMMEDKGGYYKEEDDCSPYDDTNDGYDTQEEEEDPSPRGRKCHTTPIQKSANDFFDPAPNTDDAVKPTPQSRGKDEVIDIQDDNDDESHPNKNIGVKAGKENQLTTKRRISSMKVAMGVKKPPPAPSLFADVGKDKAIATTKRSHQATIDPEGAMQTVLQNVSSTTVATAPRIVRRTSTADHALTKAEKSEPKQVVREEEDRSFMGLSKRNGAKKARGKPLNNTVLRCTPRQDISKPLLTAEDTYVDKDESADESTRRCSKRGNKGRKKKHDDGDEAWDGFPEQKSRRAQRDSYHGADNPIEIADSEDEEDSRILQQSQGSEGSNMKTRKVNLIDLVRVSIGSLYSKTHCSLRLKPTRLCLTFMPRDSLKGCEHVIAFEHVQEFKYSLPRANGNMLIVMRVHPNKDNGLLSHSEYYLSKLDSQNESSHAHKGYIVLEIRTGEPFHKLLAWMRGKGTLRAFVAKENESIDEHESEQYALTMLTQIKKEGHTKSTRKKRKTRKSAKAKSHNNKVMLVFPFDEEEEKVDSAAEGLTEAKLVIEQATAKGNDDDQSGCPEVELGMSGMQIDSGESECSRTCNAIDNASKEGGDYDRGVSPSWTEGDQGSDSDSHLNSKQVQEEGAMVDKVELRKKTRAHFLTIRQEDFDRLDEGEFLNDTLIDFWMQWMMRKEDKQNSPVHIFSSHFYTTLSEEGHDAVQSWTAKKNVDVFSKNFLFIPVNKSLHWSLCVVVNPGDILRSSVSLVKSEKNDFDNPSPGSCILFLDSLQAHKKNDVAENVRKWLNAEWKRTREDEKPYPFDRVTMKLYTPKIPTQNNSWDCGVFVCRYAHALFMRRHQIITVGDQHDKFRRAVRDRAEFDFDMGDIERIRKELKGLITNLGKMYVTYDRRQQIKEREAKKNAKKLLDQPTQESEETSTGHAVATINGSVSESVKQPQFCPRTREQFQSTKKEAREGSRKQVFRKPGHELEDNGTYDNAVATNRTAEERQELSSEQEEVESSQIKEGEAQEEIFCV